ncbi:TonB-dependent receptor family protein [Membranicola marinus]|uniref:TonB-dependent receptor family protein n=1 Tax=Membranihabitans marinus TaxID=1227546 RepID=A0A953HVJ4_9BACT|nr:TonB-dependent receptor [Membranihabitans marinus]MBY5958623.1 TonB-dependent receptor family protein [Membranihabitans marinus]
MKTFLFLLLFLSAFAAVGQNGTLRGLISDENQEPLVAANVVVVHTNTAKVHTATTDIDGGFRMDDLPKGAYLVEVTYVGFQKLVRQIEVDAASVDLGILRMKPGVELDELTIEGEVVPVQLRGDTSVYDAAAYKTLPDANAEDLIAKMPTVVLQDGKVQTQGEDVKKVLVDGKPFFGNDPTAALRNLPSEVIDKIEIFDQQSEQANFTGFEDGETSKTINIVTKASMRNGQFGKIQGGYGYEDKYQAGGNLNIFNGDQRISLIGMSNNVNQQNFSTEDLLGVVGSSGNSRGGRGGRGSGGGPGGGGRGRGGSGSSTSDFMVGQQGGITNTTAAGINFSDQWGDKTEVTASYFFNKGDNTTKQLLSQQFFGEQGNNEMYSEDNLSQSTNYNHRFSAKVDYTINENNSLNWRPGISLQTNKGIQSVFGQTMQAQDLLSQSDYDFTADLSALNFNNDLTWKHKFNKPRRTFSVRINSGYAPRKGSSYLYSENIFQDNIGIPSILDQYASLDNSSWNASANLQFTEPIGEKAMLMMNYRSSYQQEESHKETYDMDEGSEEYDLFNPDLSNVFSNDYVTQSLGTGYNYRSGDFSMMSRAGLQYANLLNEQRVPMVNTYENSYWNVLPMAMLRYKFSRSENLRLMYRTSTQLPSIDQLQNVLNNSNPLQLTVGNPDLNQSYNHSLFARYTKTNTEKSSVFFAMVGGSLTNDYIANSTFLAADQHPILDQYDVEKGAQLTLPVNLDGQWNIRSFLTYGFPLRPLQSNLNIDLTGGFIRSPGLVNEELNYSDNTNVGIGLTLGSNFSERVDFTLSSRSNFNTVQNTLQEALSTDYFNQSTRLKFDWVLGNGIVFRTDATHQFYSGLDDSFDQNYLLWNMSIGKKLFKNDRGEISLGVFDLLNQNNSLTRQVTETFIEDVQTNVLQQYLMLSFKMDIRHFKVGL